MSNIPELTSPVSGPHVAVMIKEISDAGAIAFLYESMKSGNDVIKLTAIDFIKFTNKEIATLLNKYASQTEDASLSEYAKKALTRIRKNIPSEQQGWLSVSETDESGALSLSDEDGE